jgi:outer membrane lipoprotein-sorting protein
MAVLLSSLLAISPAEVHTKLVNAYNRISSFQAGVSQTNNYSSLKRTITYQGNIYYVPGKMLMHFTRPQIQRLQIDNGKITMYGRNVQYHPAR